MSLRHNSRPALAAALAILAGCAPAAPSPTAMMAGADSLDAAFLAAFNRRDASAVAALYADSAVSIGPDGAIATGRDQIEAGMKQVLAAMPGLRLELPERHGRVEGTTVVTWGKSRLTATGADGSPKLLMEGRFSDVKARFGGRWLYVIDHASAPLPAPPADSAAK